MAITPGWKTNAEGEQEYFDKGAVKTPQVLPRVAEALAKGQVDADRIDYVEWPTKVHGQEEQGI